MQIVVGSKLDIFLQAPAADWEQGTKKINTMRSIKQLSRRHSRLKDFTQ
jgi:hypothetical protein